MPAKAVVVDASALGAVLLGEPRAGEALSLLDGADLYAPSLLDYELTSLARKKALRYPEQRDAIFEVLRLGLALELHRLALETGLTAYDACYLHLARSLDIPLVTFDEQLKAAL